MMTLILLPIKVSLDDVVQLMAMRGVYLCHQTIHNWVQTFGVELGLKLRVRRKDKNSKKWNIDATYIKLKDTVAILSSYR